MPFRYLFILIFCTLILAGCGSGVFFSPNEVKNMIGITSYPEQENYPEADAVTLCEYHNNMLKINSSGFESTENVHVVKKLFKNIEDNSIVNIYLSAGEKIKDINARTILPDGTIKVLDEKDFYTSTGDIGTYDVLKNTKFTFPALEKNCIIEYNYTIVKDSPFLYDSWTIQSKNPKLLNVYSLTLPKILLLKESQGGAGWDWNYYFANCERVTPDVVKNANSEGTITGEMLTYIWTQKEIPGIDVEPEMPPINNYLRQVKFAPNDFKTWNELSDWYYKKIFEPKMKSSSTIEVLSKSLTSHCQNDKQKIDSIFNFVKKMKYIDVSMMQSGITPHTPEKILKNDYADCKDKSMLLITLLKEAKFNAKPVLVRTNDISELNTDFPAWYFNHMIVKVEDKDKKIYWLDASDPYAKAGDLPYNVEGVTALTVNENGTSNFNDLPQSMAKDNSREFNVNLAVNDNHDGIYSINIKYKGKYNSSERSYFKDKTNKEIEEHCKKLVADNFLNAEISNCKTTALDDSIPSFVLSFNLKVPGIVKNQQDLLMLDYDPFKLFADTKWLVKEKRTYPVQLDFPYQTRKYFEVTLPSDIMKNLTIPKDKDLYSQGFVYKKRYLNTEANKLVITEEARFANKMIDTKSYPEIRSNIETIKKKSAEKLIIKAN
ncbi:MAG: DUF3857 domain-containing protein [Bacteroidota bacterium]|nr:DUF3857 domain-containing protein [Bacteroidota bacterium]